MWNPREDDNLGSIATWTRRHDFNDEHVITKGYGDEMHLIVLDKHDKKVTRLHLTGTANEILRALGRIAAIVLPIYKYEHGCLHLSTESFIGRAHHAEWDSGIIGWIFVTKAEIRARYGVNRVTKAVLEQAEKALVAEIEAYDNYINGYEDDDYSEEGEDE